MAAAAARSSQCPKVGAAIRSIPSLGRGRGDRSRRDVVSR